MMSDWGNHDLLYVELRMREMRAAAEEARLARQARQAREPRRLRRRVGTLLIKAGEALAHYPVATTDPEGATTKA